MKHAHTTDEARHEAAARIHRDRTRHAHSLFSAAVNAREIAKDMAKPDGDPHCTPAWCAIRVRRYRALMRRHALAWRAYVKTLGAAPKPPQAEMAF